MFEVILSACETDDARFSRRKRERTNRVSAGISDFSSYWDALCRSHASQRMFVHVQYSCTRIYGSYKRYSGCANYCKSEAISIWSWHLSHKNILRLNRLSHFHFVGTKYTNFDCASYNGNVFLKYSTRWITKFRIYTRSKHFFWTCLKIVIFIRLFRQKITSIPLIRFFPFHKMLALQGCSRLFGSNK